MPSEQRQLDQLAVDLAFVVGVEAPIPPRYRKAAADFIRQTIEDWKTRKVSVYAE